MLENKKMKIFLPLKVDNIINSIYSTQCIQQVIVSGKKEMIKSVSTTF